MGADRAGRIRFPAGTTPDQKALVLDCQKMRAFLDRAEAGFDFRGGEVHSVVWFGKHRDKPGMILFESDALTREGEAFPGTFTLIRGDAAAVLPVLRTPDGAEWTVLVRQPRIASGDDAYEELPAGMVDEGVFMSTAIREMEEEVGADLAIGEDDLRFLRSFHPSVGGSDEVVRVYYAERDVSFETIEALRGRRAGAEEEGERIGVEVIPLPDLAHRATSDAKAIVAYYGYMAVRGLVADPGPGVERRDTPPPMALSQSR